MASCIVSYIDTEGLRHTVEVEAESLYEAAVLAIRTFKKHECEPGQVSTLEVVRSSVIHTITPKRSGWTIGNRVWIRDDHCDAKFILAHELGHTFGASHSSIPGSTNEATYGDASSNMGGLLLQADSVTRRPADPTTLYIWNRTAHWNAPGKINAGWLTGNSVQTVSVGGSYRVAMLEQAPSTDPQVLKIGTKYISYRRAVGYDSDLWNVCGFHAGGWAACTPGQYVDKTSVHTGGNGRETILLANLGDGQSFTDGSGLTVTQTRHDSIYAYLMVTFSAPRRAR